MDHNQKDLSIETLRGFAIILIVLGHAIGSKADGGMRVADDSFLRHLYFSFQYIQIPLFTAISGWVYGLKPLKETGFSTFILKKVKRILIPMTMVGGVFYIIQSFVPGTNYTFPLSSIWKILLFPYSLYWFIQALFLVFIFIAFIDSLGFCKIFQYWLLLVGLSLVLLFLRDSFIPEAINNYFGIKGALYLLPFFLLGLGFQRFNEFLARKSLFTLTVLIFVLSLFIQQLIWYDLINYELSARHGLGLLISITSVMVLIRINFQIKWLIWIGNFAYTIYLFHSFATSGGRIILNGLGMNNTVIVFFVSLFAGLFFPILIDPVLDYFKLTRMLFLGRIYNRVVRLSAIERGNP